MINEKIEKIKNHFKENKKLYFIGVSGVFAGITWSIMRGRYADVPRVSDRSDEITVRPLSFLSNKIDQSTHIVNVIEKEGRGHPGYIVRCLETGDIYLSQYKTAKAFNVSPSIISGHLNEKLTDVNGYHLERVGIPI